MIDYQSELLLLENDVLRIKVSPLVGASIYSFQYNLDGRFIDIMRPTPSEAVKNINPGAFSSFNMIPYSNRIEKGILLHGAQTYQLAINNPEGHAIHGEVRERPWEVINHTKNSVELEFHSPDYQGISWPFWFSARIKFTIVENRLTIGIIVQNLSDQEMPAGMGIHPYLVRYLTEEDDQVLLKIPVKGVYPGDTPVPTGCWQAPAEKLDFSVKKELTTEFIDKCYRVDSQPVTVDWVKSRVRLTMTADPVFQHLVLYCPKDDQTCFAVEPVTNCNNGFNMANQGIKDTGTVYLKSNQKLNGSITFTLDRIS